MCENLFWIGWNRRYVNFRGGQKPPIRGLHVTCDTHIRTWLSYFSQKSCVKIWFRLAEAFKSCRGNIKKRDNKIKQNHRRSSKQYPYGKFFPCGWNINKFLFQTLIGWPPLIWMPRKSYPLPPPPTLTPPPPLFSTPLVCVDINSHLNIIILQLITNINSYTRTYMYL